MLQSWSLDGYQLKAKVLATEGESDSTGLLLQAQKARLIKMCLAPMTLSTKSGHVQACRLVHGLYMANLTKCFDMCHCVY